MQQIDSTYITCNFSHEWDNVGGASYAGFPEEVLGGFGVVVYNKSMKKESIKNKTVIYQAKSGAIELRGDFTRETIWANRMQMAEMFSVNPQAISKHIRNIYEEKELQRKATSSKMELVQNESGRTVKRQVDIYNLDILIAVGYRINSIVGTKFRQWATKTLREYITRGYAINRKRVAGNYDAFMRAVEDVRALLPAGMKADTGSILELIKVFADTWLSLDAYDKDALVTRGATKKSVQFTADMLVGALGALKTSLMEKEEATDLFANERERGSVAGIVGNVMQAFGGGEAYPSVEKKAAHLLYFIVKNHPFLDGNKRSGAYAFVWFLAKAKALDTARITPPALTAITLLVAESNPKDKEKMVRLILTMLARGK